MDITVLIFGYIIGSIATYFIFKRHWVETGANATLDMLMKNNFLRWRSVNGEIEFLRLDKEHD